MLVYFRRTAVIKNKLWLVIFHHLVSSCIKGQTMSRISFMPQVKTLFKSPQYIKPLGFRMLPLLSIQTLCRCSLIDEGEWPCVWDERCRTRERESEDRPCLFTRPTHRLIWHIEATLPFWATCLWALALLSLTHAAASSSRLSSQERQRCR